MALPPTRFQRFKAYVRAGWSQLTVARAISGFVYTVVAFFFFNMLNYGARLAVDRESVPERLVPLHTPFTVANEGFLPAADVEFRCQFRRTRAKNNVEIDSPKGFLYVAAMNGHGEYLEPITIRPGEKTHFFCTTTDSEYDKKVYGAEIVIEVSFRLWPLPLKKVRRQAFQTARWSDTEWRWLPKLDVNPPK